MHSLPPIIKYTIGKIVVPPPKGLSCVSQIVATLTLGSWTRQGVARLQAKRETRESCHMLQRVQRVWGNEPSHSQVNSHVGSWSPKRTHEFSERNYKGQNSLPIRVLYIIETILKHRCLKWARIVHLDIWNTSYGQKKGRESNWQFDARPLKVKNWPDYLVCRQRATYRWKALDEGYNFASYLIIIGGLHKNLYAFKVARAPTVGISSPGTKNHLDVAPMKRHKVYYKREGGGFPQVRAVVSLMLVLCRFVWMIEVCHFFVVPSRSPNTPFYPFIVLRAKEHAPTPCSSVVFNLGLTFESLKELGARHKWVWVAYD